jgi:hypothetical protein
MRIDPGDGVEDQSAGFHDDVLLLDRAVPWHCQLLGDTCASEGHVQEIIAGLEFELGRTAFRTGKQWQLAVGAGRRMEDPPGQAMPERFAVLCQCRFHPDGPADRRGRAIGICRCIFCQARQSDFGIAGVAEGILSAGSGRWRQQCQGRE